MHVQNHEKDRFRGALLGLACGNALGCAVQSEEPGNFEPLSEMRGGGPLGLAAGEWSTETSLALCLAHSLLVSQGFDPRDQLERYDRWARDGYQSCTGKVYRAHEVLEEALQRFHQNGFHYAGSISCCSADSGSIVRLAPVAMYYSDHLMSAVHYSGESSRTSHGHPKCLDACKLLGLYIYRALNGAGKGAILAPAAESTLTTVAIDDISLGSFRDKQAEMVRATGYVGDTLEAALWCFHSTDSFRDAVLTAANLGDESAATAAICGQLAGAYYGESGIPAHWVDRLAWHDDIRVLCDELYAASHSQDEEIKAGQVISLDGARQPS